METHPKFYQHECRVIGQREALLYFNGALRIQFNVQQKLFYKYAENAESWRGSKWPASSICSVLPPLLHEEPPPRVLLLGRQKGKHGRCHSPRVRNIFHVAGPWVLGHVPAVWHPALREAALCFCRTSTEKGNHAARSCDATPLIAG